MSAPPAPVPASSTDTATAENTRLDQPSNAVLMDNMDLKPTDAVDSPAGDNSNSNSNDRDRTDVAAQSVNTIDKTTVGSAAGTSSETGVANNPEETLATTKGKEREGQIDSRPPAQERMDSVMAIGPAQDDLKPLTPGINDAGPVCSITLLLTTGSRHPYRIDAKYLNKRNVAIPEETESGLPNPLSITIYTLKELILREWRTEWEAKPASPSSIRLIHFGKLLDDKDQLKKYNFSPENPNVVHMSVRPPDLDEEEPRAGSKNLAASGTDNTRTRSGGCCIIL